MTDCLTTPSYRRWLVSSTHRHRQNLIWTLVDCSRPRTVKPIASAQFSDHLWPRNNSRPALLDATGGTPARCQSFGSRRIHRCDEVLLTKGPSIKYVTLSLANFDPLPLSHFVTHPGTPKSMSHISDPLRFLVGLVQETRTKAPCTNSLSIVRKGFCSGVLSGGLLSGRFCPGGFYPFPFCQKVKHHFKYHVSFVR